MSDLAIKICECTDPMIVCNQYGCRCQLCGGLEREAGEELLQWPKSLSSQQLRIINIDKAIEPSVYEKEIWNKAIEAAAKLMEDWEEKAEANAIRDLKK